MSISSGPQMKLGSGTRHELIGMFVQNVSALASELGARRNWQMIELGTMNSVGEELERKLMDVQEWYCVACSSNFYWHTGTSGMKQPENCPVCDSHVIVKLPER